MKTKLATIERVGSKLALVDEAGVVILTQPWQDDIAGNQLAFDAWLLGYTLKSKASKPE